MLLHEPQRPWWKEPMVWLVVGLPLSAVMAGFATYFIAAHEADTLVTNDMHKEGLILVKTMTPADRVAAQLGLIAQLRARHGALEARLTNYPRTAPKRLHLVLMHPTRQSRDIALILERDIGGEAYRALLPDLDRGRYGLILEAEDRGWRLVGQWLAPFSTTLELRAQETNSSTHP